MRLATAPALALLACTASHPPDQVQVHEQPPTRPASEPPTSERDRPLTLEPGELMRIRGTGGVCNDLTILVVHADGRFERTLHHGCRKGLTPGDRPRTPGQPELRTATLNPADLAELNRLLAEPTLAHTLESIKGGSSSDDPTRLEFLVRTPAGEARGEYIGYRLQERSPFHAFVDSLYARL